MSENVQHNAETVAVDWAGIKCPTCRTDWPAGTQFDDEDWKEQALRHCIRADRAEALLATYSEYLAAHNDHWSKVWTCPCGRICYSEAELKAHALVIHNDGSRDAD